MDIRDEYDKENVRWKIPTIILFHSFFEREDCHEAGEVISLVGIACCVNRYKGAGARAQDLGVLQHHLHRSANRYIVSMSGKMVG